MSNASNSKRLRLVAELIAVRLGERLLEASRKLIAEKEGDYVWSFDIDIERKAVEMIKLLLPNTLVITEDAGTIRLSENPKYVVILDPVDGSNNHAHDIPWFCTCVAIAPIYATSLDDIIASAVYAPVTSKLFSFSKDEGALVEGRKIERSKPIKMISAYFDTSTQFKVIEKYCKLRGGGLKVRSLGSIALELSYVAWGKLEGVVDLRGRLRNTDIAAPYPILKASGADIVIDKPIPATSFAKGFEFAAFYNKELGNIYRKAKAEVM